MKLFRFLVAACLFADTPPTRIQEAEVDWSTTTDPKTTASFNVLTDDVLACFSITADNSVVGAVTVSGGSLTWTQRQVVAVNNYTRADVWTATVDSDKSMTVTCDPASGGSANDLFGCNVLTFRGSGGVGASSKNNATGAAPTLNITTTAANSAIVVASGDWAAVDGASRTWRTGAGALTEQTYFRNASYYTVYGGYHADAGAIGTYAVGQSAPGGQTYSIVAVEIKGTAAGAPTLIRRRPVVF